MKTAPKQYGCCSLVFLLGLAGFVGFVILIANAPKLPAPSGGDAREATSAGLSPGDRAVCLHNAWFAVDDSAYDEMLDAQNAKSVDLLGRLMGQGRVFREKSGTEVLIVRTAMFSVFCRIGPGGDNPGAEGWIQRGRVVLAK